MKTQSGLLVTQVIQAPLINNVRVQSHVTDNT